MPINSKLKGKAGELEFCKIMREYGYDLKRSVQYNGKAEEGQPDVLGLDYIHPEVKRVEKLNVEKAVVQAIRDSDGKGLPTVFHRKNRGRWLVTMPLDSWIELYNEYYSGRKLEDR